MSDVTNHYVVRPKREVEEQYESLRSSLEFKRMSDVTNHYVVRVKRETEEQYESLRSAFGKTMQHQGWMVEQINFIPGTRSLNDDELKKNLEYFKVPIVRIETIRSKQDMKIFDDS